MVDRGRTGLKGQEKLRFNKYESERANCPWDGQAQSFRCLFKKFMEVQ